MATPNVGILTNAGKNLIDQVNAGQTKITFSKIVFSSMDNSQLTDDQVKALTAITPQEVVVDNPEVTLDNNTGETRIRATGNNEALTDGVYVKTYAVYAKDDSGNESLYGITVSPNPNYLPEYDGVTPQAVTYSYKVNISNTSNITFTNSNDVYVSETDLAEAVQPYAKTVDVNQQLATKADNDKVVHLDDLLGGRNYAIGSNSLTAIDNGFGNNYPIGLVFELSPDVWGKQVTISYTATISGFTGVSSNPTETYAYVDLKLYQALGGNYGSRGATVAITKDGDYSVVWKGYIGDLASGGKSQGNFRTNLNSGAKITISKLMVELGEVQHDWVPAPEDKADDSKVVHNTGDETIADTKTFTSPIIGTLKTYEIKDGYDLNGYTTDGTYFTNGTENLVNYPTNASKWATLVVHAISTTTATQTLIDTNNDIYVRTLGGSPATWSAWHLLSDDSEVAHLSGANNFDTVPTVNNKNVITTDILNSSLGLKQDKIGYTPADDSKVVHTADMRKPSSDVVGLEDVSTAVNKGKLSGGTDLHTLTNEGIYNLNGQAFVNFIDENNHWGTIQVINQNAIVIHIVRATSNNSGDHIWWESLSGSPSVWSTWHLLSDDSKVAHLSGANNFDTVPAVNNTPIVTSTDLSTGLATKADDSKVVHNTGDETIADTKTFTSPIIGTLKTYEIKDGYDLNGYTTDGTYFTNGTENLVNYPTNASKWATLVVHAISTTTATQTLIDTNNDIYVRTLGGSPATWSAWHLLSDDSKVAHLSGANNFDTTPTVNNNPLLLTSSLPSDLARTSQQTNFTAGLQSGGVSVATSDDLKSVKADAWHPVSVSMANFTIENAFYKKDNAKMTYELFIIAKEDIDNYAGQKGILFQDSNIHSFGGLNPDTVYGEFGLTYASLDGITGKVITKCSTSGNKIYYENSYSGYGPVTEGTINICGYIHITGTFE